MTKELKEKIVSAMKEMLDAVGIINGPSHTEIKIIDGKIYLIEINDRPGGDHITYPLTELSTGYPYLSGIIWASMGELEGKEPIDLKEYFAGIILITDKTKNMLDIFNDCEKYEWLYYKNVVNKGISKIKYNNADGLNYFIYYSKTENLVKMFFCGDIGATEVLIIIRTYH